MYAASLYYVVFFLRIRRPPRSTLFPYTTPFRSHHRPPAPPRARPCHRAPPPPRRAQLLPAARRPAPARRRLNVRTRRQRVRSEEHTSELQSRQYLVCRLLLEKKNRTAQPSPARY